MREPLIINESLTIPASDLSWEAARSSGPGGQNVNKVSSKVELRFDLLSTTVLSEATKERLRTQCRSRLSADGTLLVVSQATRDQARNLEDAREKLRDLVLCALHRPRPRVATRPSRAAKARRVADKRHHSGRKREREVREE